MIPRGRELIATNKSAILAKTQFDPIVVESNQSYGRFPNSPSANQSNWGEAFCEVNNLLNQLVASEEVPWRWRR